MKELKAQGVIQAVQMRMHPPQKDMWFHFQNTKGTATTLQINIAGLWEALGHRLSNLGLYKGSESENAPYVQAEVCSHTAFSL